ncbi:MAG: ATP-binding protein [Candidatus Omnitrophica bacterium]|nr:ATP-binding protein [Candidatus Omnitrophota bacterium]
MFIQRAIADSIEKRIFQDNKIIILYGPRQSGKTTLVKKILENFSHLKILSISGDELKYTNILSSQDFDKLKLLVTGYDLLFLDEAQRIPNIGINLKILHDNLPDLKIIATGSSSFDLANKIKEPLTGRTWTYTLFPISVQELAVKNNSFEIDQLKEQLLVFGSYPNIFSIENINNKKQYLIELATSYLYKDVLEFAAIKHASKIHDLLKLLAFQIGSEVSITELALNLGINKDTVNTYIDLLEKAFVVFRLSGFSRNLRKEITKMDKIYFYDLGVRNIIIENLNFLDSRDDVGKLWENFLMIERKKHSIYNQIFSGQYFWRTYSGSELDYIEERDGKLFGYEFKYSFKKHSKAPAAWIKTYPESSFECVDQNNWQKFVI